MYDQFADDYARHSENSPANRYYDRPAILALAGDVAGQRVLELGCAAGALSEQLVDRGADLHGLDREPRMVQLATDRLGNRARFDVADLGEPLSMVESDSVDLVVASLVLHYLKDWSRPLEELHRCLAPGGSLVMSVHHPAADWEWAGFPEYLTTTQIHDTWRLGDRSVQVSYYRRPLSEVFGQLHNAGFTVDHLVEPRPLPELRDIDPRAFEELNTKPAFLHLRARTA
ncbi:class I SAM-dependent methyltransferase [Saccharopolyspora taberi]|uniref:Methyltransferase type 11 domain-containing protein n=1 Tax=Saccharopolyspora taberi TaxID=60895 RepID=A0ABN3VI89_9PSEU